MNEYRVMVYVGPADESTRKEVEQRATLLASYPDAMLVQADETQLKALQELGVELEVQEQSTMIRLRSVQFDTREAPPAPPAALAHRAAAPAAAEHWIVQFVGPVKPEWSEALVGLGGRLGDYIPENAYLVEMTDAVKTRAQQLEGVAWIGPYQPAYKLSPFLMGTKAPASAENLATRSVSTADFPARPEGNINVLLHDAGQLDAVAAAIGDLGGSVLERGRSMLRAALDPAAFEQLAQLPGVKWIEPYRPPKLSNDVAAGIIGVQPVWDNHGLDGEEQIVAVCDTGIDRGVNDNTMHADFRGRIVNIHDRVGDGANDVNSGHGTHVAGSVLGNGSESNGDIRGMAPAARLVFQAIERNSNEHLDGIPADYNTLFQQSYNDGARIMTNSWGNDSFGQYTSETQDIDEFMWDHKDAVILYCAMNAGTDADSDGVVDDDSVSSQGCAKNCITVGASENNRAAGGYNPGGICQTYGGCWPADYPVNPLRNDRLSDDPEGMVAFSSRGPTDDGRIKPDVVAPGTNILSVRSHVASGHGWGLLPAADANRADYMYMGGTSMATPLTAGSVALIRQYLQKVHLHASPTGALLKAMLIHGARPLTGQYTPAEVDDVPDNSQGWGRVNLGTTLVPSFPLRIEFRDAAAQAVGTGQTRSYDYVVTDTSEPFRATLAWTDFPSNPAAAGLVNRLRLSVVRPNGTTVQGDPGDNNVQQVVIDTPQAGTYQVRVRGVNVTTQATTGDLQDFALVVSAGLEYVDLYIRDNNDDNGIEPSHGTLYRSPDIWVSQADDPAAAPAASTEYGQTNYVFVRVHNRGTLAANNAEVKLYWAHAGTNLSRPHWQTAGLGVGGSAGNAQQVSVPAQGAGGPGEVITAAFEWTPPNPEDYTVQPGHFCLFATVTHPRDPLLQEDVSAVRWEGNLAWKNLEVQDTLPNGTGSLEFYVAGNPEAAATASLHIDRTGLPAGGVVELKLPSRYLDEGTTTNLNRIWQSAGGLVSRVGVSGGQTADIEGFGLRAGENTLVHLEVTLPPGAADGELYPVFVEQRTDGVLTGRVTLLARTRSTPAYIGNRNSGELHLVNCHWVDKMSSRNKVPYDDMELALRRGYNGCRFCLPEKDTG